MTHFFTETKGVAQITLKFCFQWCNGLELYSATLRFNALLHGASTTGHEVHGAL